MFEILFIQYCEKLIFAMDEIFKESTLHQHLEEATRKMNPDITTNLCAVSIKN